MTTNIVTRWEDWRNLRGGDGRHRRAVDAWLETHPAILYWGDSWFSTPLYPNLARQSAAGIDGLVMIVGKPGATAAELLSTGNVKRMIDQIKANPFHVMCISIGGNDALSDRLEAIFPDWIGHEKASLTAEQAFDMVLGSGLFDRLVDRYRRLLDSVAAGVIPTRPAFEVVGQSYAPLRRIGVAGDLTIGNIGLIAILKDDVGPWLWRPMKWVLADIADGARFSDLLLAEGFRDRVLVVLRNEYPGLFSFADIANVVALDDKSLWYDEIHPTAAGFAACAPILNSAIRAALPEPKRHAIA